MFAEKASFDSMILLKIGLKLHKGVCKKLRDLLDAILLFGNTLMIHKNTTCLCYVMLGLVNIELDMSYDTQVRVEKMHTCFIVIKCTHILYLQNAFTLWRSKTCMRFGEQQKIVLVHG